MNYFKVNHFTGLRSLGIFTRIQHRYSVLFNLLFQVAQFPFHFITATHLTNKFPLKSVDIRIQLTIKKEPSEEGTKNTINKNQKKKLSYYNIMYLRPETEPVPIHRVRIRRRTRLHSAKTIGTGPFPRCGTAIPWLRFGGPRSPMER